MANFFFPVTSPKGKKMYRCTWCAYPILEGEQHRQQYGFYDGAAQNNRFHEECWESVIQEGGEEFIPGSGEPPQRMVHWVRQQKKNT